MAFDEHTICRLAALAAEALNDPKATAREKALAGCVLMEVADHSQNAMIRAALTAKVPHKRTVVETLITEVPRENAIAAWARSGGRQNADGIC